MRPRPFSLPACFTQLGRVAGSARATVPKLRMGYADRVVVNICVWIDSSAAKAVEGRLGLERAIHFEVRFLWLQDTARQRSFEMPKILSDLMNLFGLVNARLVASWRRLPGPHKGGLCALASRLELGRVEVHVERRRDAAGASERFQSVGSPVCGSQRFSARINLLAVELAQQFRQDVAFKRWEVGEGVMPMLLFRR